MTALLVAILVGQIADGGDVPLRPPEMIDDLGNITPLVPEDLVPGVVCSTHLQAAKQRDDKAACHAALATLQTPPENPVVLPVLVSVVVSLLVGGAVAAGTICATGHCK